MSLRVSVGAVALPVKRAKQIHFDLIYVVLQFCATDKPVSYVKNCTQKLIVMYIKSHFLVLAI